MTPYHYFGIIAATTFMLTVIGLFYQLTLVLHRRRFFMSIVMKNDSPTNILSLNQLTSIFLACYAFFLYALCVEPMNHYLAWPRLIAMLELLVLFYQILIDRRNQSSAIVFYLSTGLLFFSGFVLLFRDELQNLGKNIAQGLVIMATIVLAQGYFHQVMLIRRSGQTGAVSIRFHQCVLLTALSTITFGLAIGLKDGWPLILLASVSATLKLITLWHFRWARVSKVAESRRNKLLI